jgi:hypothetical protein
MDTVLTRPLFEKGDLVTFIGYRSRQFMYKSFKKKWENKLGDLGCPIKQKNCIFLVIEAVSAKDLFERSKYGSLSSKDNGYVVISQKDGLFYFVYENEIKFLEVNNGNV